MKDDETKFSDEQKAQIDKFGVTVYPYLPHVTACYVNLPTEPKTPLLQQAAENLQIKYSSNEEYKEFRGEYIALVELGRNGNAWNVIEQIPLAGESEVAI